MDMFQVKSKDHLNYSNLLTTVNFIAYDTIFLSHGGGGWVISVLFKNPHEIKLYTWHNTPSLLSCFCN
jgi:hypothetical protein